MPVLMFGSDAGRDEIWSLEESYWAHLKKGELDTWNRQWHPRYVGWPHDSGQPIHRDDIIRLNEQVLGALKEGTLEYRLLRHEIVVMGDVAVAHYSFHWRATDQSGARVFRSGKVTHTWYRDEGGWQILSGMSAPAVVVGD